MATICKKNSQRSKWYRLSYYGSPDRTIWNAYKNPSYEKEKAYHNYVESLEHDYNIDVETIKIISHNTFTFTIAGITVGREKLVVMTPYNVYIIPGPIY